MPSEPVRYSLLARRILPSLERMSMIQHGFYLLEIVPMSFGEPSVGEIDHLA